jgi:hypothetical protein
VQYKNCNSPSQTKTINHGKEKENKKTTGRRRARVGAIDKQGLMQAALAVGGAVGAHLLSNAADKMFESKPLSPEIKGAALFAIGQFVLPKIIKSSAGKALGMGVSVYGGYTAVKEVAKISGLGDVDVKYLPMSSTGITSQVSGNGVSEMVSGASRTALYS